MTGTRSPELLLVFPVPLLERDGKLLLESQACHGVEMWANHFETVVCAFPQIPESLAAERMAVWSPVEALSCRSRVSFECLPWAYHPATFVRELRGTRSRLRDLIRGARYLHFAIGGLVGDWGTVAALEARALGLPYGTHTDWVVHQVIRRSAAAARLRRRIKTAIECALMPPVHARIFRDARVALCNGRSCFEAYRRYNPNTFLIHDLHTTEGDLADDSVISAKLRRASESAFLRVCYAGRLEPMKAPLDWLRAVARARALGALIEASWYGDGSLMEAARAERDRLGLQGAVALEGFVEDRDRVMAHLREADLFLMTHVTEESPRCLIEAMVAATPVAGYDSAYARDILSGEDCGVLTSLGDPDALGERLAELCRDRDTLRGMIERAAARGRDFTGERVFSHRAQLLQRYL